MKILIINGPNMNLLGKRKLDVYGKKSYKDLLSYIKAYCKNSPQELYPDFFQTNHEGKIVDALQNADNNFDGIVLNAAAYSHYSIAIHDAIEAIGTPVIEVHMSDIKKREKFRHKSVLEDVCVSTIIGHGFDSYTLAIKFLIKNKWKD